MNIWDKLSNVDVSDKEKFCKLFSDVVNKIKDNKYNFEDVKGEDYLIVNENRLNSLFVHVVPKEVLSLFEEMREKASNEFLGFSVLAGKKDGKDVRVSCFGIPCNLLAKALI